MEWQWTAPWWTCWDGETGGACSSAPGSHGLTFSSSWKIQYVKFVDQGKRAVGNAWGEVRGLSCLIDTWIVTLIWQEATSLIRVNEEPPLIPRWQERNISSWLCSFVRPLLFSYKHHLERAFVTWPVIPAAGCTAVSTRSSVGFLPKELQQWTLKLREHCSCKGLGTAKVSVSLREHFTVFIV